jgi:hypothetical protein
VYSVTVDDNGARVHRYCSSKHSFSVVRYIVLTARADISSAYPTGHTNGTPKDPKRPSYLVHIRVLGIEASLYHFVTLLPQSRRHPLRVHSCSTFGSVSRSWTCFERFECLACTTVQHSSLCLMCISTTSVAPSCLLALPATITWLN